ncbi:MAG: EAL domain-containing protein [Gluconacetobacter diazotrophicus]|nr:EAL domain-containing protein [Gluconacetobacter diazotrophicus]
MRWRRRTQDPRGSIRVGGALVIIFTALVLVSRMLFPDALGYSAIWPANAAIAVAVLALPGRQVAAVLAACLGINMLVDLLTITTPPDIPMRQLLNVASGTATGMLVRRFCGAGVNLMRLRRLVAFASIVFSVSSCEPVLDELVFSGTPLLGTALADCLFWTLEDGLGFLIGIPAILAALRGLDDTRDGASGQVEPWGLLLLAAFAFAIVFSFPYVAPLFLVHPLLIFLAFRIGPSWLFAAILAIAMTGASLNARGYGPIAELAADPLRREMTLQCYLVSLFLIAVPTAAVLRGRGIAMRRLRRLKESLQRASLRDPLTQLANRTAFQERLEAHLRGGTDGTVMFVDLDRFKEVNDTLGHQAGDSLLAIFGNRLRVCLAGRDAVIARFGGDEFMILVPGERTEAEMDRLCDGLLEAARLPYELLGDEIHVGICIGAVDHVAGAGDAQELMRRADVALYAAKRAGRDGYRIFHEKLDRELHESRTLEEELRRAVAKGTDLELHYQPKLDRFDRLTGVEALLRWTHPRLGPIPADRTIQVAELSGLIMPLGFWILRQAAAFAGRWPSLHVAINVSPRQLEHPDFAGEVLSILGPASADARQLELEITEMTLFRDSDHALDNLRALKRAGLGIALDDFGTGYSSFQRLQRFSIDRVKIDRSFVHNLGRVAGTEEIVRAIVHVGHAMGLQVTAEGVETEAHRTFLLDAGVDELQGFLLARPVAERDLEAHVLASRRGGDIAHPAPADAGGSAGTA